MATVYTYESNELYHFGVKGMKWGVRRYQKDAGSYTRKGIKNFNESADNYESAKRKLKDARKAKDKASVRDSKAEVEAARYKMRNDYDQVKRDHLADQGKRLRQQGKTISGNYKANALAQAGIMIGSRVAQKMIMGSTGNMAVASLAASTIGVGGTVVNAIIAGKTYSNNAKLRAYYSHGR